MAEQKKDVFGILFTVNVTSIGISDYQRNVMFQTVMKLKNFPVFENILLFTQTINQFFPH